MSPEKSRQVDLKRSSEAVGHLYPVLKAADGEILDGFHRKDSDPTWPERILENVTTQEEKLLVQAHSNLGRRQISRKERMDLVLTLAELYEKQGLQVRAPFTFTRRDPRLGLVEQVSYRNEIVERISEVLDGCLVKGTIQAYLKGSRFMQEKGPQPEEKKTRTELHELYRKMGPLRCLRRFYARELREKFSRTFIRDLEAELEERAKEDLRQDLGFINEVKEELRAELQEEVDAWLVMNRQIVTSYFEEELRRIQAGEPFEDVVDKRDRRLLKRYRLVETVHVSQHGTRGLYELRLTDLALEELSHLEEPRPPTAMSGEAMEILKEGRLLAAGAHE